MADSIIAENDLPNQASEVLMYKGLVYQNSGFTSQGLQLLFEAKQIIEPLNNKIIESELNYYIALASYEIGEYVLSRKYLNIAIKSRLNDNDYIWLMEHYLLIANTFSTADSIYKYLQLANEISKLKRMDYNKATLLNNMALFYKATGKISQAKIAYLEAINISITNGYQDHLSNLYNNYAYLLMTERNYDSAKLVLEKALSISKHLNNIDVEASVLDSYSDYYVAIDDPAQAFEYHKKSVKLKNEYRKNQQIEKSLFLSTVFETEKKEKEIARQDSELYRIYFFLFAAVSLFAFAVVVLVYFRHKSAIRKARIKTMDHEKKLEVANAMIEGQDTERKRIAMDLHDGISPKVGALKLMFDTHFEASKHHDEFSNSIYDIDQNIREISHRMLPVSLERNGLVISIEEYIASIKQSNNIDIIFFSNLKSRLPENHEVNIYFIVYELINNAIKYAQASELSIQLVDMDNKLCLNVDDDGIGFNPGKVKSGIGLNNVRQRVSYLNGETIIDSVIGKGTTVLINIKKP